MRCKNLYRSAYFLNECLDYDQDQPMRWKNLYKSAKFLNDCIANEMQESLKICLIFEWFHSQWDARIVIQSDHMLDCSANDKRGRKNQLITCRTVHCVQPMRGIVQVDKIKQPMRCKDHDSCSHARLQSQWGAWVSTNQLIARRT